MTRRRAVTTEEDPAPAAAAPPFRTRVGGALSHSELIEAHLADYRRLMTAGDVNAARCKAIDLAHLGYTVEDAPPEPAPPEPAPAGVLEPYGPVRGAPSTLDAADVVGRLRRLEDAFVALLSFVTDGQPERASRSLGAGAHGVELVAALAAIRAERGG